VAVSVALPPSGEPILFPADDAITAGPSATFALAYGHDHHFHVLAAHMLGPVDATACETLQAAAVAHAPTVRKQLKAALKRAIK
jgi:hypothetical protein